jgi:hypothetical protein
MIADSAVGIAKGNGTGIDFGDFCILQGDILQVEYTDPTDASGESNSVTDSATFDLRNVRSCCRNINTR